MKSKEGIKIMSELWDMMQIGRCKISWIVSGNNSVIKVLSI